MSQPPREQPIFPSTARTATHNSDTFDNEAGHRGILVFIDCTAVSGVGPSATFTIQGKEPASGDEWYTILASAAITAAGNTVLRAFPGSKVTANTHENDQLPRQWRILATHATADSLTYSVGACLLP